MAEQQNREAIMEKKKEWSGKAENLETDFEGIRDCRVEVAKPEPVPLPQGLVFRAQTIWNQHGQGNGPAKHFSRIAAFHGASGAKNGSVPGTFAL